MGIPVKRPAVPTWYSKNMDSILKADAYIGQKLADKKTVTEYTSAALCDEVFSNLMSTVKGADDSENSSILLLGEAGSGKTHLVESCISKILTLPQSTAVLRAHGKNYNNDLECIRHLATQLTDSVVALPRVNASFEQGMSWLRNLLQETFRSTGAIIIVLDKFEHFCSRTRQTLLYNLFDIAQEAHVRLSIIGMSEKMDVMDSLEKRIKSRFSMRHVLTFLPTNIDALVKVLFSKLQLPATCDLSRNFKCQFNRHLMSALLAKRHMWKPDAELGRPPTWFLAQCLPLSGLLMEYLEEESFCSQGPSAKRLRTAVEPPSASTYSATHVLLRNLCDSEHIVLLGLYRLNQRGATSTLSTVLHEIAMLHENSCFTGDRHVDGYCAAFDRLTQMKLVQVCSSADVAKRYAKCCSLVGSSYDAFVHNLGELDARMHNPVKQLPFPVQEWALAAKNKR